MKSSVQKWWRIQAALEVVIAGAGVPGLAPTCAIRRASDNMYLQAGGGAWNAGFAVNPMVEVDAVNLPGLYAYSVPNAQLFADLGARGYSFKVAEGTTPLVEYTTVTVENEFSGQLGLGLATAGAPNTVTFGVWAPPTTAYWAGLAVTILQGTGVGQTRRIGAYSNARVATVDSNWVVQPDATSVCVVHAQAAVDTVAWNGKRPNDLTVANNVKVDVEEWRALVPTTLSAANNVQSDVEEWRGALPNPLATGNVQSDVELWRNAVPATLSAGGNVASDLQRWLGSAPLPLVAQLVQSAVAAMGNDTITAAVLHASAGAELADAVWDEPMSGHGTGGTAGGQMRLALSMLQRNHRIKNPTYDADNRLLTCNLVYYPTTADALADSNALLTLHMVATYDGDGNMQTFLVRE